MPLSPGTRLGHYDVTDLIGEDGTVKVLDFGLSKALDTAPEGDRFLAIVPASVTEDAAEARDYTMVLDWFEELRARAPVP